MLCEALVAHDWPGNAREIRNVMETLLALTGGRQQLGLDELLAAFPNWAGDRQASRAYAGAAGAGTEAVLWLGPLQTGAADTRASLPLKAGAIVQGRHSPERNSQAEETAAVSAPPNTTASPQRQRFEREDALARLLATHRRLTAREVAQLLAVSRPTATSLLRAACAAGLARKIMPNRSPVSHYFAWIDPDGGSRG
jgi:DNA-binding NtrC family response regulator